MAKLAFNPFTGTLDYVGEGPSKILVDCLVTDQVGQLMHISGPSVGSVYQAECVDIANFAKMPAIGILLLKSDTTRGIVVLSGIVPGTSLLPGRLYFAGSNGFPTATRPVAPLGGGVFVQPIGKALDATRLLLEPSLNMTRVIT